jgi:hypothetical protein
MAFFTLNLDFLRLDALTNGYGSHFFSLNNTLLFFQLHLQKFLIRYFAIFLRLDRVLKLFVVRCLVADSGCCMIIAFLIKKKKINFIKTHAIKLSTFTINASFINYFSFGKYCFCQRKLFTGLVCDCLFIFFFRD